MGGERKMKSDIEKYFKNCKKVFPFIGNKEKKFFNNFRENINDHVKENQEITYQDLVNQIGSPKDIMISYIQDCDDEYIINKMNTKKIIKLATITITTILIIGLSIITLLELKTIQEAKKMKIITEEIEIVQEETW